MNSFQWMVRRYTGAHVTLSADELKQLEQRCNEIVTAQQRRFWIIILLTAITTALMAALGGRLIGPVIAAWTGFNRDWCTGVSAIVLAILTISAWMFIYTLLYVRPLRRALSELGYEVCEKCGYWLNALPETTQQCPECGTPRVKEAAS